METALPKRMKLRKLIVDPKLAKSNIERLDPSLVIP
jgi:hypothetical protein